MSKRHRILTWSAYLSLIVSAGLIDDSLAQVNPLQTRLAGQWTVDENAERSDPIDRQPFFAVAESYLTAAGQSFRESYIGEADDPAASCPMVGALADRPVDFEITDRGNFVDIAAFGRMRRVYMNFELEPPETFIPNALGWSVGRWVDDMLVIKTTDFTEGAVRSGERTLPFGGPIAQIVERYTLNEDQNRLSIAINLNDPKFYRFSVRVRHHYVRAENILRSSNCVPLSSR